MLCLQSTLTAMGLRVTSVQMQAATAVVPPPKDTSAGMTTSAIVGLCVAAFLAVLLAAGAYYVCVHRQCISWSNKVRLPHLAHCTGTLPATNLSRVPAQHKIHKNIWRIQVVLRVRFHRMLSCRTGWPMSKQLRECE